MTDAETEYLQAAERVIALAERLIVSPEDKPMAELDALTELRLGLLVRSTNNVATVAYLGVAAYTAPDPDDPNAITRELNPVEPSEEFAVFPPVAVVTEDVIRGIAFGVRASTTGDGKLSMTDAVVPPYIESAIGPHEVVINGAMPVIVKLMKKVNKFNNDEAVDRGARRMRERHRTLVGLPKAT